MQNPKIIGVDLGTTNTVLAYLDEVGDPQIVRTPEGDNLTPSAVYIDPETDQTSIGKEALRLSDQGFSIFRDYKRDIGSDTVYLEINSKKITPETLSTLVLKKISTDFDPNISQAVITVPANFGVDRREATLASGKLADLPVSQVINEPSAAAFYFAMKSNLKPGKYAVYDFGGGTWDISIVSVSGTEVEILESEGISKLGGKDFDEKLQDLVEKKFQSETDSEINYSIQNFRASSLFEELKKSLSINEERKVIIRREEGPPVTLTVTRSEFESSVSGLLAQSEMICSTLLKKHDDLLDILLVGGSTRIPAVKESILKVFGKHPITVDNPDEVVALGAALYSGLKSDKTILNSAQSELLERVNFKEVSNMYFGVIAVSFNETTNQLDLMPTYIIDKGTPIPSEPITEQYTTIYENQTNSKIQVIQSSMPEKDVKWVDILWEDDFPLPPGLPQGEPIDFTFQMLEDGTVDCHFLHKPSSSEQSVNITPQYEVTKEKKLEIEEFFVE
ncbi:MAG: hypothetical protein CL782_00310 [Chloroflexi bacterium]|nr:hypothetical protein [Chloroflexota bacterium]|tara:strand:- start:3050 stop:4564 length:1515 start_codon:yes stop_codon:yes gene_type:complete